MSKVARFYVGIDLHKSVIQMCVLNRHGRKLREKRWQGASLEQGLRVVDDLARWYKDGRIAVEAIGLNRWFVEACQQRGLDVVVADPIELKLKQKGRKTDRRDAFEIARRLYLGDIDRSARTYFPSAAQYGARKVLRTRHKLISVRQQLTNQIRSVLNAYRIGPLPGRLHSSANLQRLRRLSLPADLQRCVQALQDSLEAVQRSIAALEARIRELSLERDARTLRRHLPSVGAQTAVTLLHELGAVRRFRNSRAVASHVGLVPKVSQSADRSHHGRLTKRGNRELRWILSQWAVRLLSRDRMVQAWARPRLKRSHRNKVRMALARRLLVGVYVMLSRGEVFSLRRCLGM